MDRFNSLSLNKKWSIARQKHIFSITIHALKSGPEKFPWQHYKAYMMSSSFVKRRHNATLVSLTKGNPIYLTVEITITRRGVGEG